MLCAVILLGFAGICAKGQTSRNSVPASEVNGTFRMYFKGKYRGSSSEIKIWALGHNKLQVAFDPIYPFTDGQGELSANMGMADGVVPIKGDRAVYTSNQFGDCTITIKFLRPGTIKVTQNGTDSDCGFGHNVSADGTYKKVSSKKPKFEREDQ
jgi:hypothetical protein